MSAIIISEEVLKYMACVNLSSKRSPTNGMSLPAFTPQPAE